MPSQHGLHVGFDHRTRRGPVQAMFVSFGMAEAQGGECILRFDDTNPEAEKKEYIDHIQEIVSWMGWTPAKVTSFLAAKQLSLLKSPHHCATELRVFASAPVSVLRSRIVERHACQRHDLALNHVQGTSVNIAYAAHNSFCALNML